MHRITRTSVCCAVAACIALHARPALAVVIDWVYVGDAGNASDTATNCYAASCGSVSHAYSISKYEITNAQYAEFLNAKATSDPLGLYNANMASGYGGITRSGDPGSYSYSAIAGRETMPVSWVSFYDAVRFANWMNNGQGSGETEDGAYSLLGGTAYPSNGPTVTRNGGASIFLPSENEWYKAAYYDPVLAVYFDYPTGNNGVTGCVAAGSDSGNSANCALAVGDLTSVGAYSLSESPYGTFDQGGNMYEWNDTIVPEYSIPHPSDPPILTRGFRGGWFKSQPGELGAAYRNYNYPDAETGGGFRLVMLPEPGSLLLVITGLLCGRWGRGWSRRSYGPPQPR